MRSLVSFVRIDKVSPVEDSDRLDVAQVGGWKIVTKRDEFKPGDLAVYFEIDSFIPACDTFDFLRKNSFKVYNGHEGYRLRTIKLRGQVSQGLLVPVSTLLDFGTLTEFEFKPFGKDVIVKVEEGEDLTEALGVVKYDLEVVMNSGGPNRSKPAGTFPSFIVKTDETRIQDPKMVKNVMKFLSKNPKSTWYATSKLDGSSITIYKRDDHVGVCSRNQELVDEPRSAFWRVAREVGLVDFVTNYPGNIALQGELVGPGIQSNRLKLQKNDIYIFSAFDIDNFEYFTGYLLKGLIKLANDNGYKNIKMVPVIEPWFQLPDNKEDLLSFCEKLAERTSPIAEGDPQEGVVIRPIFNNDISFKFISPSYLLKHGI